MGLLDKLFGKKKEVVFETVKDNILFLENQNGRIENPTKEDLVTYLDCLFCEVVQFITLSLANAENGIRYMQATFAGNDLIVQLGIEKDNTTRLVEKVCLNNQQCVDIFYQFYDFQIVDHVDEYTPVQF